MDNKKENAIRAHATKSPIPPRGDGVRPGTRTLLAGSRLLPLVPPRTRVRPRSSWPTFEGTRQCRKAPRSILLVREALGQCRDFAAVPGREISSTAEELARSQFARPRVISRAAHVRTPPKLEVHPGVGQAVRSRADIGTPPSASPCRVGRTRQSAHSDSYTG